MSAIKLIISGLVMALYIDEAVSAISPETKDLLKEYSPRDERALEKMFANYVRQHRKPYMNSLVEYQLRRVIFQMNLAMIDKLNKKDLGNAKYGINKFSDMTQAEFKASLGYRNKLAVGEPSSKEINFDALWNELLKVENKTEKELLSLLPKSFDWRHYKGTVAEVKNQGSCGSCWSFATTGSIEGQYRIIHNRSISLSEQELIDCDHINQGCSGGLPELAYEQVIKLGGLATEDNYPYVGFGTGQCKLDGIMGEKFNIDGFTLLPQNDENKLMIWLVKRGPISIAINANTMQFYEAGIAHSSEDSCSKSIDALNHAILIVGYGSEQITSKHTSGQQQSEQQVPYWIVKNSWGADWGESGYYRVYRGDNTCGLALDPTTAILNKK